MTHALDTVAVRSPRREQILTAAVSLFSERGYHATGMADIGAAVGITGPGIYRHFRNKEAILETAVLQAGSQVAERLARLTARGGSPEETLRLLVDSHVEALLTFPALSLTVLGELGVLSEPARASVQQLVQRHVDQWVTALRGIRPELRDAESRMLVYGVFGLSHAVERLRPELDREELAAMLHGMAMAILLSDSGRLAA